ncbi:hypothetical protein K439DRAFT_1616292 [Ramaria rubella]|nr:hypothetical protein K439DRAFT_1616292 [Ramaria rubella]
MWVGTSGIKETKGSCVELGTTTVGVLVQREGGVDLSTFEVERDTDWVKRLLVRFQETPGTKLYLWFLTVRMSRKNPKKTFSCLSSLDQFFRPIYLVRRDQSLKQCQIWETGLSLTFIPTSRGVYYWKDLPKVTDPVKVSVHDGYFVKVSRRTPCGL